MREIKFRGKRVDNREWVYGWYYENNGKSFICWQNFSDSSDTDHVHEVLPETVGQYTVLKDFIGREIFEGDIVQNHNYPYDTNVVECHNGMFTFEKDLPIGLDVEGVKRATDVMEILGNIHDNPELLK